jgi:hypothetical protein
MSIDNSELLMLLGGKKKKAEQTIGIAGQQGFGVGVYGGSPSDLKAMGLSPMEGYKDPTSENYGSYIHTNGSVMAFIPAFAIRIGNTSAPLYSKYGADTIEIGDVKLAGKDGWAIPRGFYDGGEEHPGFFIDKYLNSKDAAKKQAISVKNGDPIALSSSYNKSSELPNCVGQILDAIELSRARGEHYSLVSCYQWAVISLITQAHAQAAAGTEACAWYDASGQKNYPKGSNNNGSDVDDNTIRFTAAGSGSYTYVRKTGSAAPLAKTTHNGQVSGICDVNGNMWQPVLGWQNPSSQKIKLAKLSVKMHDFTKANRNNNDLFDDVTIAVGGGTYYWQKGKALYSDTSGSGWAMNGVLPKTIAGTSADAMYGKDYVYLNYGSDRVLLVAGRYRDGADAGSWCRDGYSLWSNGVSSASFRASAYPP